jgi:hypothetical protein
MRSLFTDRFGGVSVAPFKSLNLALHVGDDPARVACNRDLLRQNIGASKLVFMEQIHGDTVVRIETGDEKPVCDAMITDQEGIGLVVMVADCIPVLLWDEATRAIGVAHAGREGTRLGVAQKCALAMRESYGVDLKTLHVSMGPSIHACCYEVGLEVTKGFENFLHVRNEKYFLDLQRCNEEAFKMIGLLPEHIEVSNECSCCSKRFFSYRREQKTGRFAGAICL